MSPGGQGGPLDPASGVPTDGSASGTTPTASSLALCTFWIGDRLCAVDVARVAEVLPRVVPSANPGDPPHVEGRVLLEGEPVPVVDLRRLLSAGPPPRTARPRVLVVRVGQRRLGLRVDGLAGVRDVPVSELRLEGVAAPVLAVAPGRDGAPDCALVDVRGLTDRG